MSFLSDYYYSESTGYPFCHYNFLRFRTAKINYTGSTVLASGNFSSMKLPSGTAKQRLNILLSESFS